MARLNDLRVLRNYLLICDASSLAVAAIRANVSQPALSKQVAALETELGVRLLDRHARGIRLTEAGQALRDRAGGLLRDAERVVAEVGLAATRITGEVAIGAVSSLRGFLLAPAVATFLREHPETRVSVFEGTSRAMREAVVDGRVDLALIAAREDASPLVLQPFATEPLLAIGPSNALLRADRPVPLAELAGRPLILASAPNSIRTLLEEAMARRRLQVVIRAEVENSATAVDLVRLGTGWTVFTHAAVARALVEREITAAPIQSLQIAWALARSRDRRPSAVASALWDTVASTAAELLRSGHWQDARPME